MLRPTEFRHIHFPAVRMHLAEASKRLRSSASPPTRWRKWRFRQVVKGSLVFVALAMLGSRAAALAAPPDLILHHGKIVTVDKHFSQAEAVAISGERIVAVGTNADVQKLAGAQTQQFDLQGRTVIPGLIDSHVHSTGAALYEFDHTVPDMETIADVLAYVKSRADSLEEGDWINVNQVFITRLRDQRFPTRYELDQVAPKNPVFFRTGPDAAVNSLALKLSGIDRDYQLPEGQLGRLERDPKTGEPNGILRSCTGIIKYKGSNAKRPTAEERVERIRQLFADYNSVGLTSVCDRGGSQSGIDAYQALLEKDQLTCRVFLSYSVNARQPIEQVRENILKAAEHPLHTYNNMIWVRGIKIFLDGGMLTGSAYMRQPWGVSSIYSITDPSYRGLIYVEPEPLYEMAKFALEHDLQFTAHSVGDGAVHALIGTYERINQDFPVSGMRPCITHCNFMSREAIEKMKQLGIVADLQPAWLWLDGKTLLRQFGEDRTAFFQPYHTIFEQGVVVGGGSDHMQKIGSIRSVNPYNPFLGMWITLARQPRWTDQPLHPEQRITREQALRLYTINNAFLTFEEHEKGSIEVGKLADLVVLKQDYLTCPLDEVKEIQVAATYLGGRLVYEAK